MESELCRAARRRKAELAEMSEEIIPWLLDKSDIVCEKEIFQSDVTEGELREFCENSDTDYSSALTVLILQDIRNRADMDGMTRRLFTKWFRHQMLALLNDFQEGKVSVAEYQPGMTKLVDAYNDRMSRFIDVISEGIDVVAIHHTGIQGLEQVCREHGFSSVTAMREYIMAGMEILYEASNMD